MVLSIMSSQTGPEAAKHPWSTTPPCPTVGVMCSLCASLGPVGHQGVFNKCEKILYVLLGQQWFSTCNACMDAILPR